jgi:phenylalanyl-tRNA synthetase alpha chain
MDNLAGLRSEILSNLENSSDLKTLEELRVAELGKQGRVSLLMKSLGSLDPEERKLKGQEYNSLREAVVTALEHRKSLLEQAEINERLKTESLDVSLPAREISEGRIHPFTQTLYEIIAIFKDMGFDVAEGTDIENDYYNFTALNIPPTHPSRQEADTFYLPHAPDGTPMLLRTQTSPIQIRTMQTTKPPIRIIAPGRTYRNESDATHTPNFHQIEGLLVDKVVNMGHLKGCLVEFCERFFEVKNLSARFRPGFFPFTEPGAEMDIGCTRTKDKMTIGGNDDWLEILGCGMIHPQVLLNCGIDPNEYQGFAFGMGIERPAMLKYGIPDLRSFYDSDVRWMRHHGFSVVQALTTNEG